MMPKGPQRIGRILEDILTDAGYLTVCREYEVVRRWPEIAGQRIAAVSECSRVEEGVLHVRVFSAAWCQELAYVKKELLNRIRSETGCTTVRDIVFHR